VNEVQRYTPDRALSFISGKLEAAGFAVRKSVRGSEVTELKVTNPAGLGRGSISINRDGFVSWEHTAAISDDKSIREIVDVITVLLTATAPGETGSDDDRPSPDPAEGMLS
jgi:hypothetical protein